MNMKTNKQTTIIVVSVASAVVVLVLAIWMFFRFWFPYAEGTDTGELNYFCKQGVLFKTYEGKMIQTGLKAKAAASAGVESNEFRFSVEDEVVADSLMHCTGKNVTLHYKRYFHSLPWRGESVFVVDSIWMVSK